MFAGMVGMAILKEMRRIITFTINNTENRDQYADYITLLQDVLMDGINDMRKR